VVYLLARNTNNNKEPKREIKEKIYTEAKEENQKKKKKTTE
jgi:hypothetical protein